MGVTFRVFISDLIRVFSSHHFPSFLGDTSTAHIQGIRYQILSSITIFGFKKQTPQNPDSPNSTELPGQQDTEEKTIVQEGFTGFRISLDGRDRIGRDQNCLL